jgi:hypothetical protein
MKDMKKIKKRTVRVTVAAIIAGVLFLMFRSCGCSGEAALPHEGQETQHERRTGNGTQDAKPDNRPDVPSPTPDAPALEDSRGKTAATSSRQIADTQIPAATNKAQDAKPDKRPAPPSAAPALRVPEERQGKTAAPPSQQMADTQIPAAANEAQDTKQDKSPGVPAATPDTADATPPDAVITDSLPPAVKRKPFRYEASLHGTFGMSQLSDGITGGSMRTTGALPGFGAEFTWYFDNYRGVSIGADAAFFKARLFTSDFGTSTQDGSLYVREQTSQFSATYLRIPLLLRLRMPLRRHWFYAAAGISCDIALDGRHHTETEETAGNRPHPETAVTDESLPFSNGVALITEAGLRWSLGEHWGIYTGVYAGYGITNVAPQNDALIKAGKMNPLSAGAKVAITFGWGKKKVK